MEDWLGVITPWHRVLGLSQMLLLLYSTNLQEWIHKQFNGRFEKVITTNIVFPHGWDTYNSSNPAICWNFVEFSFRPSNVKPNRVQFQGMNDIIFWFDVGLTLYHISVQSCLHGDESTNWSNYKSKMMKIHTKRKDKTYTLPIYILLNMQNFWSNQIFLINSYWQC